MNRLYLLLAPPGWGKTHKILNLIKNSSAQFVFIFPLRALCQEVYISALKANISTLCLDGKPARKLYERLDYQLIISTPEMARGLNFENRIYLLDEFHLFYYWGEEFREAMLDFMEEHLKSSPPLILLSATIKSEFIQKIKTQFSSTYQEMLLWNFGNQVLKNQPRRVYFSFSKALILQESLWSQSSGVSVIFCQYREEVQQVARLLRSYHKKVISCVGGEAKEFSLKILKDQNWDFIVATSVISHGVNLPQIRRIFFTFKVRELDMYLQMIGRGGRAGEPFDVYTMNMNYFSHFKLLKGLIYWPFKILSHKWNSLIYYLYES